MATTGTRYQQPYAIAADANGVPLPGALLNFYLTGTATRAATYSDVALSILNANPVAALSNGQFPAIFLDPTVTYKVVLTDSTGAGGWTADPVSSGVAALTSGLALGAAAYQPIGTSGAVLGLLNANLTFAGSNAHTGFETFAGGAHIIPDAAPLPNDVGYMGFPPSATTGPHTIGQVDLGMDLQFAATGVLTIPSNATLAIAPGQGVMVSAMNGAVVTINIGGTDTLAWLSGNVVGSGRTVTGRGYAFLWKKTATEWWIFGPNVT